MIIIIIFIPIDVIVVSGGDVIVTVSEKYLSLLFSST